MAKVCKCCGKPIGLFEDYRSCGDNGALCKKCSEPINGDFAKLYNAKTKEDFDALAVVIIGKSKAVFNDSITKDIYSIIEKYRLYNNFPQADFSVESIAPIVVEGCAENKNESNGNYRSSDGLSVQTNSASTGMFSNIGGKIKTLAKVLTWIGIIASVILGFSMMASGDETLAFIGMAAAGLGSLLSWVSSFLFYGFGQLIENSDKLVRLLDKE